MLNLKTVFCLEAGFRVCLAKTKTAVIFRAY